MKKYLITGLVGLIIVSVVSTYYTNDMNQREIERGGTISEETSHIKDQITEVESSISQIETKKSETEPLILEEQQKQKEIEENITVLNSQKLQLEESIDLYKEIEKKDPRVLIMLEDPVVRAKVEEVTRLCKTTEEKQQAIFEYVRKEIKYVTEGNPKEYSYPQSYLRFKFDFWQLPRETIEWRSGDCEDVSILLCTMMRTAGVPASDIRIMLGTIYFEGFLLGGHAWTEFKMGDQWYVLESTCVTCNYIEKSEYYAFFTPKIWGWFNDKEYHQEKSRETEGQMKLILV